MNTSGLVYIFMCRDATQKASRGLRHELTLLFSFSISRNPGGTNIILNNNNKKSNYVTEISDTGTDRKSEPAVFIDDD